MVVDPRRIGAKRARKSKVAARFSLYEKNEARMVALQEQLDSEKKKVAKQDKEISKLQKMERNLREYLDDVLQKLGCQPVPDYSEDESQDEGEHEVDDRFTWDDVQEDENNYAGDDDDLQEDENNYVGDDDDLQEDENNYVGDNDDLPVNGCADDNQENELSGEDE
ncbi:glutamic acid-rich protein-like isoform X1 [Papaver somniferum]|uniref:glutamic acid-rich protein-like isoform X1 n=1 Tax=Papaver somniferum TaxID=3469 RepID=UPI000E6F9A21|nr:glutamic acid-rich protein-like isoform X1 [Papaver somniferum]XP_026415033.1 glutamic acid-rich protein-like isoform X1 [Papaver somniferum]XP_026415034.1 glutamic acid-rich protein-like isoform X1 [Papaver somniferum]XP_026415035.1 glutamic acid-rich protein-like isoform X1 [Papaver somniferum]